jgi:hypothetical protein
MARSNTGSTSNYLEFAGAALTGAPCTLAAWVYPGNVTSEMHVIGLTTTGGDNGFLLLTIDGSQPGDPVAAYSGGSAYPQALTTAGFVANTWQHVAAVFTSASSRAAFLDGGNKGTNGTTSNPIGTIARTTVGLYRGGSTGGPFDGRIAEVGVWDVALSDEEVASLAKGFSPRLVRPGSLVGYYPLIGRYSPELDFGNGGGRPLTITGTMAQADHCRVFYRGGWQIGKAAGAAPPAPGEGLPPAPAGDAAGILAVWDQLGILGGGA